MSDWFLFKLVLDSFERSAKAPMFAEVLKQKIQKLIFGLRLRTCCPPDSLAFMANSAVPSRQTSSAEV